jgi:outer membrane protein OmpA-like peptidoglycan-associated protein
MSRTRNILACRRALVICLCGLLLALRTEPAHCQNPVADPIGRARSALEAARSERAVRALAPAQLDAAEQAFGTALAALEAQQPQVEIEHLAYLAERRATIARLHARERQAEQELIDLSAAYGPILETRLRESAAAERRTRQLAGKLQRFEVRESARGLALTPREPWFDDDVILGWRGARAIAEAAALLAELPDPAVVVEGYADAVVPEEPVADSVATADQRAAACARAEAVRAFLISHGIDPRRIRATCPRERAARHIPAEAFSMEMSGNAQLSILVAGGTARPPPMIQAAPAEQAAR